MMRKFCSLDKHCEGVIVDVTSFFISEEKTSESLTGIGNQRGMGSIPVRDSEVFSSEIKKLVTTTITPSQRS